MKTLIVDTGHGSRLGMKPRTKQKRKQSRLGQADSGAALATPSFSGPKSGVYLQSLLIKGVDGKAGIKVHNKSTQDVPL